MFLEQYTYISNEKSYVATYIKFNEQCGNIEYTRRPLLQYVESFIYFKLTL